MEENFRLVVGSTKRAFTLLLTTTLLFILIAVNLFYSFSKYQVLSDQKRKIDQAITEKEKEIETNVETLQQLQDSIVDAEKTITEVQANVYEELKPIEAEKQRLVELVNAYQLAEELDIDEWLQVEDNDWDKFLAYVRFLDDTNGQYTNLLKLDQELTANNYSGHQLSGKYEKHIEYIEAKSLDLRKFVKGNGGLNPLNTEIALQLHQYLYQQSKQLDERIIAVRETIEKRIENDPALAAANALRTELQMEKSNLESRNSRIKSELADQGTELGNIRDRIQSAAEELTQSYRISGIPISSAILLPVSHLILVAMYTWFAMHLRRVNNIFVKRQMKLSEVENEWFFLYNDDLTGIFVVVLSFVPLMYAVSLFLVSLLFLQPLIEILDPKLDYFLSSKAHFTIALISSVLLLALGVYTSYLSRRLKRSG